MIVTYNRQNIFIIQATGRRLAIIGGEVVTPHAIPYQVALSMTPSGVGQFCGGSLISPTYVLTGYLLNHFTLA
jgi:secreted trypsin-like serine protease